MGRKSNINIKRDFLINYLKTLRKNINPRTYQAYYDDIMFNKTTVNQLNKIEKDLVLIPTYGKNLKKADIKNKDQMLRTEISGILNAGVEYSTEFLYNRTLERTLNKIDKYRKVNYNGLNFYFREEYQNDDLNRLNIFDGEFIIPSVGFIQSLVLNKATL